MSTEYHELTFEKGMLESVEDSMIPLGFASSLQNWMPEPNGALRCRTGWNNTVTSGAPSTRSTRGIGELALQSIYETPSLVQSAQGSAESGAGTTVSATWPATTTAGNCLIAVVQVSNGNGSSLTFTGWTLAKRQDNAGNTGLAIYYKANASSESGTVTVTNSVNPAMNLWIAEYRNVAASNPLDQTAGTTGTGTTGDTGATAATAQSAELLIGAICTNAVRDVSAYTDEYVEVVEIDNATESVSIATKVSSATGAQQTTATISSSTEWAGAIATFKAATRSSSATGTKYFLIANKDSATAYTFYYIDQSLITTGMYTSIETVSSLTSAVPVVAFAHGLGKCLYSNYHFSALRRWNGAAAAAISGSPAGRTLAFHRNRFFSAGTAANPSRLWFSALSDETVWWDTGRAETSLTDSTNWIDIDEDDGDVIEDIATFAGGLLIAKGSSLHFLRGTGPDSFDRERLIGGGGAPGRSICATPYGAVIAGTNEVYLYGGGAPEVISKPIEDSYSITGDFVTTAYADGVIYITDEGDGTTYAFNIITGTWHKETVNSATEEPAVIYAKGTRLLMGPQAATTGSLLSYRDFPQARGRDANTSQVFSASTGELVLTDPSRDITPVNLYLQLRQHGGDSTQTGLTVTPTFYLKTGESATGTPVTITPKNAAGLFTERISAGSDEHGKGITAVKYAFSQTVGASEATLFDIEDCVLSLDISEPK